MWVFGIINLNKPVSSLMKNTEKQYTAQQIIKFIKTKKENFWLRERERKPLLLFKKAAREVPAYKDFLKKNKINPDKIKTFRDFQKIPITSKKNYLSRYPLEKLCWSGSLKKPLVFTATSGSTGEPFYFARGGELDWEASVLHELFLRNNELTTAEPTLVIIGFGMGIWIGGLITYQAFEMASRRSNLPVSIITPGINKIEIFHALKKLAPNFKQTILTGYPPFVKDVIDEAVERGINLKKLNLRLLFAAEAFTEKFRDYLVERAGIRNPFTDTLNVYGSADIGSMAFEMPTAILARRLALKDEKIFNEIFSSPHRTPTLAQYNPFFITFEAQNGEILLTGNSAVPLIRYSIGDNGDVLSFGEISRIFKKYDIDFRKEAKKADIDDKIYELPFVYVYERRDFSTKLYGAIIYSEHIKEALQDNSLNRFLTGKFSMITKYDAKQNQYLEINIELKPNIKKSKFLVKKVGQLILRKLLEKNGEYRNNYSMMPKKVIPKLIFWPYEHPLHFKPGAKQQWVKK